MLMKLQLCKEEYSMNNTNNIIKRIRQGLKEKADEDVKRCGERFFKEQVKFYGMKTPDVSKIGKEYFKEIKGQEQGGNILAL